MTIIEKMYAGEKLSEEELHYLATGCGLYCNTEPGEYEEIDLVEGGLRSLDTGHGNHHPGRQ